MSNYSWRPDIFTLTSLSPGDMTIIPGGIQNLNFIRVNGSYVSGNPIVSTTPESGFEGIEKIRVGMKLYTIASVGFPSNTATIIGVDVLNSEITVSPTPNDTTTGLIAVYPQKGMAYIESASISNPTGVAPISWNSVTGSNEVDFDQTSSWAVGAQLARTSTYDTQPATGKFGYYEISEVLTRVNSTTAHLYVTESAKYLEPSGEVIYSPSNVSNLSLASLSVTGSAPPLFHGGDFTVSEGLGLGSYNPTLGAIIDEASVGGSGAGFPFTGSAQITGSLSVTGSSTFELNQGQTTDFFLIKSSSFNPLKVNSDGVVTFGKFINTLPTAVEGGVAYSGSNFFVGIE